MILFGPPVKRLSKLDVSKINELGWKYSIGLEEGVKHLIAYLTEQDFSFEKSE